MRMLIFFAFLFLLVGSVLLGGIYLQNSDDVDSEVVHIHEDINLKSPMNIIQEKVSLGYKALDKLDFKEVKDGGN